MDRVTAYPEMKALIVFPAEGSGAGEICDTDQRKADQREEDGNEGVHVSAFPVMIGAATEDRAATGAGRGWRGGASREQRLGLGEVAHRPMIRPAARIAARVDGDGRAHAARPLRVLTK